MTLGALNVSDRDRFVAGLGWVFEHSPWVAERAWSRRPFASVDQLHAAMAEEVSVARPEEQVALLCAHPDLGTRMRMSDASTNEQAGAGLDHLTPAEFNRLQQLNAAYREKFGYPFLFAVRGSTKHDVLNALTGRLASTPDEELTEALRQLFRITRFRLHDAVSPSLSL